MPEHLTVSKLLGLEREWVKYPLKNYDSTTASAVTSFSGNCVLSNSPSHGDRGWGMIPWARCLSIHIRPVACRASHSWFHGASGRTGTDPAWRAVRDMLPFSHQPPLQQLSSGRRKGNHFQFPAPPSFLPTPLSFLSSCFSSFPFSLPFHESRYKFQPKIKTVLYFALSAVIKFRPQQGHCRFHGNQYILKPRRMTV